MTSPIARASQSPPSSPVALVQTAGPSGGTVVSTASAVPVVNPFPPPRAGSRSLKRPAGEPAVAEASKRPRIEGPDVAEPQTHELVRRLAGLPQEIRNRVYNLVLLGVALEGVEAEGDVFHGHPRPSDQMHDFALLHQMAQAILKWHRQDVGATASKEVLGHSVTLLALGSPRHGDPDITPLEAVVRHVETTNDRSTLLPAGSSQIFQALNDLPFLDDEPNVEMTPRGTARAIPSTSDQMPRTRFKVTGPLTARDLGLHAVIHQAMVGAQIDPSMTQAAFVQIAEVAQTLEPVKGSKLLGHLYHAATGLESPMGVGLALQGAFRFLAAHAREHPGASLGLVSDIAEAGVHGSPQQALAAIRHLARATNFILQVPGAPQATRRDLDARTVDSVPAIVNRLASLLSRHSDELEPEATLAAVTFVGAATRRMTALGPATSAAAPVALMLDALVKMPEADNQVRGALSGLVALAAGVHRVDPQSLSGRTRTRLLDSAQAMGFTDAQVRQFQAQLGAPSAGAS